MENQVTNNNDEIEIDLGEIFHLILSRLGVIILSGIILGVISIIGTMLPLPYRKKYNFYSIQRLY